MLKNERLLPSISEFIASTTDLKINLQELYADCKTLCKKCDFESITLNQIADEESIMRFFCSVSSKKDSYPKKSSIPVSDIILYQETLYLPIFEKKIVWGYLIIDNFLYDLDDVAKSMLSVCANSLAQHYIFHSINGKISSTSYEDLLLDYQQNISNEAILMISYEKNFCYYNNSFSHLWNMEANTNDYSSILTHISEQIKNSGDSFISPIELNKLSSTTAIIETKKDVSIHYYTKALTNIENRIAGRLWVFKPLNNNEQNLALYRNNEELILKFLDSLNGLIIRFQKNGAVTEMNSFGNHMIKRLDIQSPILSIRDIIPKYSIDGIHQWNKIDRFLQHPEIPFSDVVELYSTENEVISLLFSMSAIHINNSDDFILIGKEVTCGNYFVGNDSILNEIAALLIMSKTPNYINIISKIQKMFPCDSVIISKFFSNNKNEIYAIENLFFDFQPLVKQIRSIFKTDSSPLFYEYNNDQIVSHPLFNKDKKLVGALIFYKPYLVQKMITEDKYLIGIVTELISSAIAIEHIQQEIVYREELLTTILESISEALIALDNDGHPLYINKYAKSLIEKIIQNDHHLLYEKQQTPVRFKEYPDFFSFINNLLHKENINNNTILHFQDSEGNAQYIHHKLYPVKKDNGENIGNVMILKSLESSVSLHDPSGKVDTADFCTILAANLFHDFNSIIAEILGNLNLIKIHLDESSSIHAALQDAENACLEATNLNSKLKLYAYTSESYISHYNINEIMTEILDKIPSEIGINKNISPFPIIVTIDKKHFIEIVNHLLDNAFEAISEGGEITVATEFYTVSNTDDTFDSNNTRKNHSYGNSFPIRPGSYAKIIIQDTGYGIDKECMPYIYDPFFSTKPKHTGIGLAKVYSYVTKYQGNIEISSNPSDGTVVACYFPIQTNPISVADSLKTHSPSVKTSKNPVVYMDQENAYLQRQSPKGTLKNVQCEDAAKKQILIMDDDEAILTMLKKALQKNGYYIDIATHGDEAIEKYRSKLLTGKPYDLVIMDILIPGKKGGIETIKDLLSLCPDIKAILSSHYANAASLAEYKDYGFKGVLAKPYHLKELNNLIQQLINKNN